MVSQAVILCGGIGVRLRPLTNNVPKALVSVNERPFLEHLLSQLSRSGFKRVVLLSGYLGHQIVDAVPNPFRSMEIVHCLGDVSWSTARRLVEAIDKLDSEFLLMYSDNYASIDWVKLAEMHQARSAAVTLSVAKKQLGNVLLRDGQPAQYSVKRSKPDFEHVEIGYSIVSLKALIDQLGKNPDEESALQTALASLSIENRVWAVEIRGDYLSISTPERLLMTEKVLASKKVLLIDRDGTINQRPPRGHYVKNYSGFNWLEDSRRAIAELAHEGFSFIIITNQAGVATGDVTTEDLEDIHSHLSRDFAEIGAPLLGVLCNTEHWMSLSEMRKPGPGMLFEAAKKWEFLCERVMFVGDDIRDAEAAFRAGAQGLLVQERVEPKAPWGAMQAATLSDAVPQIINWYADSSRW